MSSTSRLPYCFTTLAPARSTPTMLLSLTVRKVTTNLKDSRPVLPAQAASESAHTHIRTLSKDIDTVRVDRLFI